MPTVEVFSGFPKIYLLGQRTLEEERKKKEARRVFLSPFSASLSRDGDLFALQRLEYVGQEMEKESLTISVRKGLGTSKEVKRGLQNCHHGFINSEGGHCVFGYFFEALTMHAGHQ